jgi:hypothetical protein
MPTDWIPIHEVRPGDQIKVPGGSSWARWSSRGQAERSEAPFRRIARVIVGWEGTSRIRLCFEDGYACQMPREARVLRTLG